MKQLIILIVLLQAAGHLSAQPLHPVDYELKHFTIRDKEAGLISFYVDTVNLNHKAPLFIDVNGSGGLPLCLYVKATDYSTVFNSFGPQVLDKMKSKYHYVILDKPETPFCDTILLHRQMKEVDFMTIAENYQPTALYTQKLSLQWRVTAIQKVITYLLQNKFWDGTKIVAYGTSEGGHVVSALAAADKRITHVIPVVGGGMNQFYNTLIDWRIKAACGQISYKQSQDSINAYLQQVKDIYRHPDATDKMYEGHTYKRWASFCSAISLDHLEKLDIPIYMIVGTLDSHTPIYGMDYIPLDFIRLGKTNLTYDVCVGCDHGLTSHENNQTIHHLDEYLEKVSIWLDKN